MNSAVESGRQPDGTLPVFPRYPNDNLHTGEKGLFAAEERVKLADRLREALR
jgi:hypothetical protein